MSVIIGLLRADWRNVHRDPISGFMLGLPLGIALMARIGLPLAAPVAERLLGFDIRPFYPFITSFLAMMPALLYGWVVGFMLLEERDEHVLTAIAVTPLGTRGYLRYRMVQPVVMATLVSMVVVHLAALAPVHTARMVPLALMAAISGPYQALFMAAFARNKVEGLALGKLSGVVMLAPLAVVAAPPPWQYLAGVFPPYWVSRAFVDMHGPAGPYWLAVAAGLIVHLAWLIVLARVFVRRRG